jgi:hypothetical protein
MAAEEASHSCLLVKSGTAAKARTSVCAEPVMHDAAPTMDALADRVLSFCLQHPSAG